MLILHLSDLHFELVDAFQKELIRELLKDLSSQIAQVGQPDFLVFSGDLVRNPDDDGIFLHFETHVLHPILSIIGVDKSRVILCPGNHDVSWSIQKSVRMQYDSLQAHLSDQAYLVEQARKRELQMYAHAISRGFFDLAAKLGSPWDNSLYRVYDYPHENVSFVSLNSAYGCSLEGSSKDRGRLALSADLVLEALQQVPAGRKIVSLVHHSPSDFNEGTARSVTPSIERYATAHLHGHVHQAKPATATSISGSCFYVQSGALYDKEGTYNGYSFIEIEDKNIEARYRSYYIDRHEFDVGTNVASKGVFYSSRAAESYFSQRIPPPTNDDVALLMMASAEAVAVANDQTVTDKTLRDSFVEPPIVSAPEERGGPAAKPEENYSISKIVQSKQDVVISADREYGLTSILRMICNYFHEKCLDLSRAQAVALISAAGLKSYEAAISAALRSAIPSSTERTLSLKALHDNSRLVVLVDDVDPGDEGHLAAIKALKHFYPKLRLIIGARLPTFSTENVVPVIGLDSFLYLQVQPLNRGRIRQIVHKFHKSTDYTEDQAVEEITTRFRALSVPLTAAYIVIYLAVWNEDKAFMPLNSSTMVESFVEKLLDKFKPEYRFRSSFDYRNQVEYLSFIAENMARKNLFRVPYDELYGWTKVYFEEIGIDQDYQKLISYFHQNKVFEESGNLTFFRYGIFLSFFIASQMQLSTEFRSWVLQAPRYANFVNEIDIYCGLSRRDVEIVNFLGEEFDKLAQQLEKLVQPLAWTEALDTLKLPRPSEKGDFADRIAEQLTSHNSAASDRDHQLDKGDEQVSPRPAEKKAEIQGVLEMWFLSLRAYSVALKNLEGISKDKKDEHLRRVLEGWASLLRYGCLLFRDLVTEKEVSAGPMKFKLNISDEIPDRVLHMMFVSIPLMISHFVRKDLGSQKLSVQLRTNSADASLAVSFLQTGLYADMKLPEYLTQLTQLRSKVAKSEFFSEATLVKLRDIFVRFNIGRTEQVAFRRLVIELSADVKGLTGEDRTRHFEKFEAELRRQSLVAKLKDESV